MAITATVATDTTSTGPSVTHVSFSDTELSLTTEASEEEAGINRTAIIERLRDKLANNTLSITPVPTSPESEEPEVSEEEETAGTLQKCLFPDDALSMIPRWPLSNVYVESREGARLVYLEETISVPSIGTSTASTTIETSAVITPLLQLTLSPVKQSAVSCIPSQIVGVSNTGVLLFNTDANAYRGIGENTQIGYARDGFPIYGVYGGEVDECGGYDHPLGYRYTVSNERPYLLGCFKGFPQPFTL